MSRSDAARRLPHSTEIERAFLGGLLLDPTQLPEVRDRVLAGDIHRPQHAALWELLCHLTDTQGGYDLELVLDEIAHRQEPERYGGIAYVVTLPNHCPSVEAIELHVAKLAALGLRRRLCLAAWSILDQAGDRSREVLDIVIDAERAVQDVSRGAQVADPVALSAAVLVEREQIAARKQERELAIAQGRPPMVGVPTGWPTLDRMLGGLRPADLVILAARPAMGKTALALNIALNAARSGIGVLVFSLEMTTGQLVGRLLSSDGGVYYQKVHQGDTDRHDDDRLDYATERLGHLRILIDDQERLPLVQILARARRAHRREPLGLIIVDYLQLIKLDRHKGVTTNDLVGEVSGGLKSMAKELGVPVLALSQLNRSCETRPDKRPLMSDLRDSGSIEQDADKVLFIYRDEVYDPDTSARGIAEINVAKNRAGETGTAKLQWRGAFQTFVEGE